MDAFDLTYEQALEHLMSGQPRRSYGIVSARGLLHMALRDRVVIDEYPPDADGVRMAVQVRLMSSGQRYWIRDVAVTLLATRTSHGASS